MPKISCISTYHTLTFVKICALSRVKKNLTHLILGIYKNRFSPKNEVHLCATCPVEQALVWKEITTKIYTSRGCLKDQRDNTREGINK